MVSSYTLPFPNSANTHWRHVPGQGPMISKKGREFRSRVMQIIGSGPWMARITEPVSVIIDLYPPTRHRRDIDNYIKPLLDALTHSRVWVDDEQVKQLTVIMHDPQPGGHCDVQVMPL